MSSPQAKVEAVKAAVSSTATCSPATVVALKELLLPEADAAPPRTKAAARLPATKAKAAAAKKATAEQPLGARDKTALATHVINATLKALADAAKPQPPSTPCKRAAQRMQTAQRASVRRSSSAPLSPLQPRALNRAASSPMVTAKDAKFVPQSQAAACLPAVECARAAFACLRALKGSGPGAKADLQLENGMSALVGKLLALGMHDQALKELRMLKRRLDGTVAAATARTTGAHAAEAASPAASMAELLDFTGSITQQSLPTISACQIQVLKLVAATKRPAHIEAVLPALRETNPTSPVNLLSRLAEANDGEGPKAARQLAVLSQLLLSMTPSLASTEDAAALEPRLSPASAVAFELQCIAFQAKLKWWGFAGHKASVDDDILSPFARCVRTLIRRQRRDESPPYQMAAEAFETMMRTIRSQNREPSTTSTSPLAFVYQMLGATAHTARAYDEANRWLRELRKCLCPQSDSAVRVCSSSARVLAAALKMVPLPPDCEDLVREVVEGLDGSLSGTVAELNELLDSLSVARRSVVGLLMVALDPKSTDKAIPDELTSLLKTFILRFPRFARRWLGNRPGRDASARQALQFDQRRQMVALSVNQFLDAALMVVKCDSAFGAMEWPLMDETLQHCASLVDSLSDASLSAAKTGQLATYHVKISTLYFGWFLDRRKKKDASNKQLLQSLSRSIDAVKDRSAPDKEKAQLSIKLELFADLCKDAGRHDDAIQTLRSICTNMAEDGVLSDVAASMACQPPALAWSASEKSSSLSRTLRAIAKLDRSWTDWTFFLPEAERAAVLEHLTKFGHGNTASLQPPRFQDPTPAALLRIYTLEKYPIRRLRVLLQLFYQNIGETDQVDELAPHVDQALQHLQQKKVDEDAALSHYIPHLQAHHVFISAMANGDASASLPSIAAWKAMTQSCRTKAELFRVIDDPETLLHQLQALRELAGLRGDSKLQLLASELSITLARAMVDTVGLVQDDLILNQNHLATQHVNIGNYTQAQKALEKTRVLIEQNEGVSPGIVAGFYLTQAEYLAGIGSLDEAYVSAAHAPGGRLANDDSLKFVCKASAICSGAHSSWAQSKTQAVVMLAMASYLQSIISLQKGHVRESLTAIRSSVRMLSHDWAKLEAALTSTDAAAAEASVSDTSMTSVDLKSSQTRTAGPQFWGLASPLLRSLLHMSFVYAHVGMFQETIYYAETAAKIAEGTRSPLYRAQVSTWTGTAYAKAGRLDRALPMFNEVENQIPHEACSSRVRCARQLAEFHQRMGNEDKVRQYLCMAEETVHLLAKCSEAPAQKAESEPARATKATKPAATTRRTVRATRAKAPAASRAAKRAPAAKAKAAPPAEPSNLPWDVYQASLLAAVMLSKAVGFISQKDWAAASATLEQTQKLPKLLSTLSQEQVVTATSLIGQSMERMISDPVFSVMQDSTISFPAICGGAGAGKAAPEQPLASTTPRGKGRSAEGKAAKERGGPAFADILHRAQELLMEAHGSAMSRADGGTVRRISTLLQSTILLLSVTPAPKGSRAVSSGLATVAVDVGRNVRWAREHEVLKVGADAEKATAEGGGAPSTMDPCMDAIEFQNKYVEVLPKTWRVISLSLSDNGHDLCMTKLQAGQSPFILRLPLERANSRDADSEVFTFEHGRKEMLDVMRLASETSHSARDFAAKGERNAWWLEREALDRRLKELLVAVETTWLGGFKGIFSQHRRQPELLSRFQARFERMLDGSLPSRSRARGRRGAAKPATVTLDGRILDLFIGLGDPADADADYDEALNDLLYFVVDILQFHGERNAYDEIDFDAMVVETYDALRGYYDTAASGERERGAHTVLVLDKALDAFPWESLPCMRGAAASRVPSLACLGQLVAQADVAGAAAAGRPPGHVVSGRAGTYMLNPSADLAKTQAYFEPVLARLGGAWTGTAGRAPAESDFARALAGSELLLYFGHGSGAQYIRGRTVRRLARCRAAAFLMGCSSAALTEAGDFESHGAVRNYMLAGCPAVVGTLWDVTDGDIDRFAGRAFEEWGLVPRGTFGGEAGGDDEGDEGDDEGGDEGDGGSDGGGGGDDMAPSLAEAVTRARDACRFRYLNAAAVVMHGIPVYIWREADAAAA